MTTFDELAEKAGDDEYAAWLTLVLSAKAEIAAFVATRHPGRGARVLNCYKGSFNLCLQIIYDDGTTPDVVIRFPKPGHTTFRDEKVVNEVRVIQFLQEMTTVPVPRLISWGLTEDSPLGVGPFMISEFVEGCDMSDVLKDPADKKRYWLDPKVDGDVLENVYAQMADIMLQLYEFDFDRIGAISKDPSTGTWSVTGRPLTYTMNELVTTCFFPEEKFPTTPFASASGYFRYLAAENRTHLWTQRNLCDSPKEARSRYISRHLFAQSVDKYVTNDHGPFKLFCDDFRPQNIIIDPTTLRIKAVLDLEFTNALPGQFASAPPWWLLLIGPDTYHLRERSIDEFVEGYEPRLQQFLHAMERAEKERGIANSDKALSSLMRESWTTKRFWFDFAARKPFDVEVLFDRCVEGSADIESLDDETRAGLEPFVDMKMKQVRAYDLECAERV